ncbi:MAG: fructose-bisphosphate aldolase [Firmicutes bacterium HGW-Firmicutes-7]|nr:MAG: fructose-bisphosphate aldolase [Firmicutes bacterium HGW-Firmicutes-7]
MLVTLKEMCTEAASTNKVVPSFNVFGYEDAKVIIEVAEELNAPVILMSNKDAVAHMDLKYSASLYRSMALETKVPVCIHLDHGQDFELCAKAIQAGYTSVMYDGSQLPLEENMKNTIEIVKMAHACGISVEAEIGSVGYSDPNIKAKRIYTEPEEAKLFAEKTGVDALAVAVGTLHRMTEQAAVLQYDRLEAIQNITSIPLVIHGSTGLTDEDLVKLTAYSIGKINLGTALRMTFGNTLRDEMNANPKEFDRIKFFKQPMIEVKKVVKEKYQLLGW